MELRGKFANDAIAVELVTEDPYVFKAPVPVPKGVKGK